MVIETDKGRIVARLYTAEEADVPATVDHFTNMANAGTFNGRTFHRVEGWVVQGGDPLGDGTGGGEMPARYNKLPFKTGSLGVARGPDPAFNNDSQFFIVTDGSMGSELTGKYTNFGEVVEGMDVVRQIAVGDKMNRVTVVENP
jgi:peptidyl-prolyl cis-trans isomerase B (cyclophilin B)